MKNPFKRIHDWIDGFEEFGKDGRQVISYKTMRRSIGILGMSLPFVLIIGSAVFFCCFELMPSVSHYYHTAMRDVFVGILFFTALFLFAYRGLTDVDRTAGVIAGFAALGVALFPTSQYPLVTGCTVECVSPPCWKTIVHFTSAAIFFVTLAFFSIFLFTRSDDRKVHPVNEKLKTYRNRLYRVCGWVIIACLILTALWKVLLKEIFPEINDLKPTFWLETIMLLAFGISWLVKGETVWKDVEKADKQSAAD